LGEAIAQRMNTIIKAAEFARNCDEQRGRSAYDRAAAEARKAFAIEPNLAAANLCLATVIEVQHGSVDSIVAYDRRALKGDPGNPTAWNQIASKLMQKGDSLGAYDAYDSLLTYNPADDHLRLGLAQLLIQGKQYDRAQRLLKAGQVQNPANQQLTDMRMRACVEGKLYKCILEMLRANVTADTTKLADTTVLKQGIANAQFDSNAVELLWWTTTAVAHYPNNMSYHKLRGGAFELAGQIDSALAEYKKVVAQNPGDVATSLLIAKTIVDHSVWDTAAAGACQRRNDTTCLSQMRAALVTKLDPARQYLTVGYAAADSAIRLTADVVGLSGGTKLSQAAAYVAAYQWLDPLLQNLAPKTPADTTGARMAIRAQASFWFLVPALQKLVPDYNGMSHSKNCGQAKDVNDELTRLKDAAALGRRIAASFVDQLRTKYIDQFDRAMGQIKKQFHCSNF